MTKDEKSLIRIIELCDNPINLGEGEGDKTFVLLTSRNIPLNIIVKFSQRRKAAIYNQLF